MLCSAMIPPLLFLFLLLYIFFFCIHIDLLEFSLICWLNLPQRIAICQLTIFSCLIKRHAWNVVHNVFWGRWGVQGNYIHTLVIYCQTWSSAVFTHIYLFFSSFLIKKKYIYKKVFLNLNHFQPKFILVLKMCCKENWKAY